MQRKKSLLLVLVLFFAVSNLWAEGTKEPRPEEAVSRLKKLAGKRLTDSGDIIIESREYRSRLMNTNSAIRKLKDLILKALAEPKKRKPTKPTRASRERRLVTKKQQSEKKTSRKKPQI